MSSLSTDQKLDRVEQHLHQRTADGPVFVKSKFIAEEMGLSAREIGNALGKLSQESTDLNVEKWSYTSATTWRVERP